VPARGRINIKGFQPVAKKLPRIIVEKNEPGLGSFIKDILIAGLIVFIVITSIFAYARVWPPLVVIDSGSMSHTYPGEGSQIGAIDAGDLVLVKEIYDTDDVTTYLEGLESHFKSYGDYGDVIIYRKLGLLGTPVIHRAIMWVEYVPENNTFSVPALADLEYGMQAQWFRESGKNSWQGFNSTETLIIKSIGFAERDLRIRFENILNSTRYLNQDVHSGFLTMGDHNLAEYGSDISLDQSGSITNEPVKVEWIVGKARGEMPWFGAIKLYFTDKSDTDRQGYNVVARNSIRSLWMTIGFIVAVPIGIDIFAYVLDKKRKKEKNGENPHWHEPISRSLEDKIEKEGVKLTFNGKMSLEKKMGRYYGSYVFTSNDMHFTGSQGLIARLFKNSQFIDMIVQFDNIKSVEFYQNKFTFKYDDEKCIGDDIKTKRIELWLTKQIGEGSSSYYSRIDEFPELMEEMVNKGRKNQ